MALPWTRGGAAPRPPSSTPFGDRPSPRSALRLAQRSAEPTVWGHAPRPPSMPKRVRVGGRDSRGVTQCPDPSGRNVSPGSHPEVNRAPSVWAAARTSRPVRPVRPKQKSREGEARNRLWLLLAVPARLTRPLIAGRHGRSAPSDGGLRGPHPPASYSLAAPSKMS